MTGKWPKITLKSFVLLTVSKLKENSALMKENGPEIKMDAIKTDQRKKGLGKRRIDPSNWNGNCSRNGQQNGRRRRRRKKKKRNSNDKVTSPRPKKTPTEEQEKREKERKLIIEKRKEITKLNCENQSKELCADCFDRWPYWMITSDVATWNGRVHFEKRKVELLIIATFGHFDACCPISVGDFHRFNRCNSWNRWRRPSIAHSLSFLWDICWFLSCHPSRLKHLRATSRPIEMRCVKNRMRIDNGAAMTVGQENRGGTCGR